MESLSTGLEIDPYYLTCDVVWPISAQERPGLAKAIGTSEQDKQLSRKEDGIDAYIYELPAGDNGDDRTKAFAR